MARVGTSARVCLRALGGMGTGIGRPPAVKLMCCLRNARRKRAKHCSALSGKRSRVPWRGGSALIRLMYETAADSTDVMTWEKATHLVEREGYRGIDFDRGKTGQPTFIPLSDRLLREIDA